MQRRNIYLAAAVLFLINFGVCYASFYQAKFGKDAIETKQDELSGQQYSTEDVRNYREANQYASAFLGFSELSDRGVSDAELTYIQDFITNYVMYDKKVYNGKISYVADSLQRESVSGINPKYHFEFGINDTNVHTVYVDFDAVTNNITISIKNSSEQQVASKSFAINSL